MKIINRKGNQKKYRVLFAITKTNDTFVIIAISSNAVTLSLTSFELTAITFFNGVARGLTLKNEVFWELTKKCMN